MQNDILFKDVCMSYILYVCYYIIAPTPTMVTAKVDSNNDTIVITVSWQVRDYVCV